MTIVYDLRWSIEEPNFYYDQIFMIIMNLLVFYGHLRGWLFVHIEPSA